MPVKTILDSGKVPVNVYTDKLDEASQRQLINIAQLPIVYPHVAAMPDVHCGIGATVGSVIPTRHAIIPAAVGVDIGCGMQAVRLSLKAAQLPDNLKKLRQAIENKIPVGMNSHDDFSLRKNVITHLKKPIDKLFECHPKLLQRAKNLNEKWKYQLGTLGGGNHFIEICLDEKGYVWVMLHSGSRGIGNAIGSYFIELAKKDMGNHLHQLPDKDLAYFSEGSQHFTDYYEAISWAQDYAYTNREQMMEIILSVLKDHLPPFILMEQAINCHHNYVAYETHYGQKLYVTRKGAIRAQTGDLGIIPGSMGACSYIVRGKGDKISFHSCAHGAGRNMSRHEAKRKFTVHDLENQTQGVECRKDYRVLDEIPAAYKNIDEVMANQTDLVEILYRLKQVICIKG